MWNYWRASIGVLLHCQTGVWASECVVALRAILCLLTTLTMPGALAAEPDWADYGQLLQQHLSQRTVSGVRLAWLDYSGLRTDPAWGRVVGQVAAFPENQLATRGENLAFHINAYNILAIKMVLDHWQVQSIKDAGNLFRSVWNKPAGRAAGQETTLDGIEQGILRKLGEPRIHMAIVCASLSCPDLRFEPYTAKKLNDQLGAASREYLNNPTKGLRVEKGSVRVSKIFDWFAEDFEPTGGVEAFIARYHPGLPEGLPVRADLPYDWSLNGQ